MKLQKGFTLIELMVAVVIVAILASLALPAYNDYVIRGKLVEATSALSDGRIKMEQYFQDHLTYDTGDGTTCPASIPASSANFSYDCSGLSNAGYLITATGIGSLSDFSYTINQANTKATTGLKAGWGTPGSCWITKKGDAC
jgi:type IV pilus assembly protein PilE